MPVFQQKTIRQEPKRQHNPNSVRILRVRRPPTRSDFYHDTLVCTASVRNGSSVLCHLTFFGSEMVTTVTTYAACFGYRPTLSGMRALTKISE